MKKYNEVAAAWWANKLRNITPACYNNGDESRVGGMGMMLAFLVADKRRPEEEKVDAFEKELAEKIKQQVEEFGRLYISCDYAPDDTLTELAYAHEIETGCFPWKTSMWISKEEVKVSPGYAWNTITIYPENNNNKGDNMNG